MEEYDQNIGIPNYPYGSAGDVYASDQVIWALMNLRHPRQFRFDQHTHPADMEPSPKSFYPQRLQELMYACIRPRPNDRITAEQLWQDIQSEVGTFKGLREVPMKIRGLPEDQV